MTYLLHHIERDSNITYYVIDKSGDLRTNTHSEGPNAVTWGVFPGKEIIQPTIVEAVSFMAWKVSYLWLFHNAKRFLILVVQDEAYELGQQWAQIYEKDSPSRKFICNLMETSYLVNVVHNDFQDADGIFQPFFKAGEEYAAAQANGVNGNGVNGHAH